MIINHVNMSMVGYKSYLHFTPHPRWDEQTDISVVLCWTRCDRVIALFNEWVSESEWPLRASAACARIYLCSLNALFPCLMLIEWVSNNTVVVLRPSIHIKQKSIAALWVYFISPSAHTDFLTSSHFSYPSTGVSILDTILHPFFSALNFFCQMILKEKH